ncbi:MAG: 4-hydroxy-tetrahydrodipicolinate reductase [Gammaproteobacteria bacterium]
MTVRIGVSGAAGRMGREVIAAVRKNKNAALAAALESPESPHLGETWPGDGISVSDNFNPADADVFIDFSVPAAAVRLAERCRAHKIALVIGATGFGDAEKSALSAAAADIALVVSPNMSAGVNAMFALVADAARYLRGCDVEIFEAHHRGKKDAPSGTALRLGEIAAAAAGTKLADAAVFSRRGLGAARESGQIGFSVMRGGDIVGEHRVIFADEGEQLEILHRSTGRANYARGAVAAAEFAAAAPPGEYDMQDVLARDESA